MSELKPNISAKDIKQFEELSKQLNTLPDVIINQIEKLEKGLVGIECKLRYQFKQEQRIYLPNYTTQIKDFGDYIGIYSDKFFFKIEGDLKKSKIEYVFIDVNEK